MTDTYATLLAAARNAYLASPALTAFAPFPADVSPQPVPVFHTRSLDLLMADTGLAGPNTTLTQAIKNAAPHAHWRETYKGTDIGQDFMDRFGCYSIIGNGGPFTSERLWMWMVYMPAHLHYPWHHHPAEEMYYVVAGQARFMRHGDADKVLAAGDTCFHASNQPHAMETGAQPVLCLVVWRNGFQTAPVLTPPERMSN